jgi:hypothetical protein
MRKSTKVSLGVLAVAAIMIAMFVTMEAMGGPTFRASEHPTLQECMSNIPSEWRPGSLERTRAEAACHYEMERRGRQPQ